MKARLLGAVALAVAALVPAACSSGASHSSGSSASVFHLKVGECLVPPSSVKAELSSVKVVSCKKPHSQEVFALVQNKAGDNYPGATALKTFADGNCLEHFSSYVGIDYRQSSLFYTYLLPSVRSWSAGDRTVVCIITTTGEALTASVQGSKR